MEKTNFGRIGFNYAIEVPNTKIALLLGFEPQSSEDFGIGEGWRFKIPYIEIYKGTPKFYYSNGYRYNIKNDHGTLSLSDYPSKHTLNIENGNYVLEKSYGEYEVFSKEGTIIKSSNQFNNVISYLYRNNKLISISYSDGSSIQIDYNESNPEIIISYKNSIKTEIASINTEEFNNKTCLSSISSINNDTISFKYLDNNGLLLSEYTVANSYTRNINYDTPKATSYVTKYADGYSENSYFKYDSNGRISCFFDGEIAKNFYKYEIDSDNNLIINEKRIYDDNNVSTINETINKYGQTTKYISDGNILSLKYLNDKLVEEKENEQTITYSYNEFGLVSTAKSSNGEVLSYIYSNDGGLIKILNKQGENILSNGSIYDSNSIETPKKSRASVQILYKIGTNIGVTNWHTVYNFSRTSFNCYTYAIGKAGQLHNPGYYKTKVDSVPSITLSNIKRLTENDQKALGRTIYDSTVGGSYNSHSWKIALRVKKNYDYHFMKKSYGNSASWEFKAGVECHVMRVLNGKNPSNITWDEYAYNYNTGKSVKVSTGYYNSTIKYMVIRD